MKNFKSAQAAVSILTVATVIGLCAAPAQAAPITISVSGVFDTVPDLLGGNVSSDLLGTSYSASYTVDTNPATATIIGRKIKESEVDFSGVPVDAHGWSFFSSVMNSDGTYSLSGTPRNTLTTTKGSFSNGQVTHITVTNNFNYDGSEGILPAGVYDILTIGGLWHNFSSCTGLSEIESNGCNNFAPGLNIFTDFMLIGTSEMFQDSLAYPLDGHMDLSKVLYGTFGLEVKFNGVTTGVAIQDPPLTLVNGVLVGPDMSVTVAVPEPGTFALLPMGLGLMGLVARRRQRNHCARPVALDCAAY